MVAIVARDIGLGGDLPGQHNETGSQQGLDGDPGRYGSAPGRRPRSRRRSGRPSCRDGPSVTDSDVKGIRPRCHERRPPGSSARTRATPATMARSFCRATSGARWRSPQSGLIIRRSAGTYSSARLIRDATSSAASTSGFLTSMTPRPSHLSQPCCRISRQVVQALAGELQDDLVHPGGLDRGEQEVVVALPGRPRVTVAVAHVQRPGGVDTLGDDVDRLDRQLDLLRVAGQERLIDLQQAGAGRGQLAGRRRAGRSARGPARPARSRRRRGSAGTARTAR